MDAAEKISHYTVCLGWEKREGGGKKGIGDIAHGPHFRLIIGRIALMLDRGEAATQQSAGHQNMFSSPC